ncbi:Organic cation transporter 1 [Orchesella cincta]|uniref:Organic cation transporter 1 n=1 Tax=Orchesella cincta TaxID=48709 RepID=A0A1D2MS72_ORCCI|nr:Organic cation transporter 1 [Orchesella cincta]
MKRESEIDETDGGAADCKRIDLDDFFKYVGEYGRYQKLLTWLIVLPACIPCGLQGFNQLFMANDVAHWCRVPEFLLSSTNLTMEQLKYLVLPKDPETNTTSSCSIRNISWAELSYFQKMDFTLTEGTEINDDFEALLDEIENIKGNVSVIPCPNGWEYDIVQLQDVHHSIVSDFDLVCGYEIYPTVSLLLFNIGGVIGVFVFGILTDLIGRKASFFVCLTFEMVGGVGCIFATDFWIWTLFRVLIGLTIPAIYQIPFIICLELVGQNYRSFLTVMTCLFYVGGMMFLPLISWLERDWRLLSIYTTVPFLLYYIYIKYLPESPRWLLAQKRTKEALDILEHLAKVNGTELPERLKERLSLQNEKREAEEAKANIKKATPGLRDLFKTPNLRLKTCLLTFCWFANATVYVGLSFYGPSLGENAYLSFFLGSFVELPGYLLCWMVMDRWGRRWPLCLAMIIGGIFDIATVLLPEGSDNIFFDFSFESDPIPLHL